MSPASTPAAAPKPTPPSPLQVDNPRWTGVPFTLRSGKALPEDSAEIAIHFRPLPRYLLDQWPGIEPNVLRVGLTEPYVRLSTTLNGPERTAEIRQLEARSTPPRFTAYAHLILEMLRGDPMLFIRGDEAEESWRIIDPVMQAWSAGDVPMRDYPRERHRQDLLAEPDQHLHVLPKPKGNSDGRARRAWCGIARARRKWAAAYDHRVGGETYVVHQAESRNIPDVE